MSVVRASSVRLGAAQARAAGGKYDWARTGLLRKATDQVTADARSCVLIHLADVAASRRGVCSQSWACDRCRWFFIGATALVGRRLDIQRHRAEAELRSMARHDALTGLLNRRSMNSALPQRHAEARADGLPITLMMCDLDHFKKLNDEYGHAVGDDVLRRTAQRVNAAVRDSDLVFRYGGEEIAVLLQCGPSDALRIAEKIREAVKAKGRRAGDEGFPPVTISIGAATSERGGTDLKELMAAADDCLYAAKDAGRDCVRHVTLA